MSKYVEPKFIVELKKELSRLIFKMKYAKISYKRRDITAYNKRLIVDNYFMIKRRLNEINQVLKMHNDYKKLYNDFREHDEQLKTIYGLE